MSKHVGIATMFTVAAIVLMVGIVQRLHAPPDGALIPLGVSAIAAVGAAAIGRAVRRVTARRREPDQRAPDVVVERAGRM